MYPKHIKEKIKELGLEGKSTKEILLIALNDSQESKKILQKEGSSLSSRGLIGALGRADTLLLTKLSEIEDKEGLEAVQEFYMIGEVV